MNEEPLQQVGSQATQATVELCYAIYMFFLALTKI